jgi:hypothetical protein
MNIKDLVVETYLNLLSADKTNEHKVLSSMKAQFLSICKQKNKEFAQSKNKKATLQDYKNSRLSLHICKDLETQARLF